MNRFLSRSSSSLVLWALAATAVCAGTPSTDPLDWPHWRGPEMNGISREKGLPATWSLEGENLLWRNTEISTRSTPIIMNGKVYLLTRHNPDSTREGEKVICLDAATGNKLWENAYNVFLTDVPAERVGWSCVSGDVETGNIFSLGVCGVLMGMDGDTGQTLWQHSMSEEYGIIHTYGGRTNVPLVFEDLVIISGVMTGWGEYAVPAHRFVAFDKRRGQPVWITSTRLRPMDTTYSAPVLTTINGQKLIVFGSGDGSIYALQPRTGKVVWSYDVSLRGVNTTPLVVGDTVYAGHSEENVADNRVMGALFAVDATGTGDVTKSKQKWLQMSRMVGRASPVLVGDKLYAVDDAATMFAFNPADGAEVGKKLRLGREIFGSPVYGDGKLYIGETSGIFYIVEPGADGPKILHKQRLEGENIRASASISHGRVYFATSGALYCLGNKDTQPSADPRPAEPAETPRTADMTPAQLQLVPVESLLKPGQKQKFQARVYNANGRYLKTVPVQLELQGPGRIDNNDTYVAPGDVPHSVATVTIKAEGQTSKARIRTIAPPPWKFDFTDGKVPATWIGAGYRHIVIDEDFFTALKAQNERAARLYVYCVTAFTNGNAPTAKFADAGPRQAWTDFLRYFSLDAEGKPTTVDEAKAQFDAGLDLLTKEGVLSKWTWGEGPGGIELTIEKGPRENKGNALLCKISTIPKGTRSQGWMGHPIYSNQTIQADLKGLERNNKLPSMGLINQRYTLDLIGPDQELQIRSWTSQLDLRFAKTIPFAWKADTWYTMKFLADTKDGKVTLRGKVWVRGEAEPADWTIEATDETPNLVGSPGLFGNASDAEVFIDNVTVTPNAG